MSDPARIRWRLRLASAPETVFTLLASDAGRARFWAEAAPERDGYVAFAFPDGTTWRAEILRREPPVAFALRYLGDCRAEFRLAPDDAGGTDLELDVAEVPAAQAREDAAGWVSVLLALKAAADFGVDLRNHDPRRTWAAGYVDN